MFSYRNKERDIDKVLKFKFKLDQLWIGKENYVQKNGKQRKKTVYESLNTIQITIL